MKYIKILHEGSWAINLFPDLFHLLVLVLLIFDGGHLSLDAGWGRTGFDAVHLLLQQEVFLLCYEQQQSNGDHGTPEAADADPAAGALPAADVLPATANPLSAAQ